eukprot:scaffold10769_cov20-Tisochrysis_lutea.AAC.1
MWNPQGIPRLMKSEAQRRWATVCCRLYTGPRAAPHSDNKKRGVCCRCCCCLSARVVGPASAAGHSTDPTFDVKVLECGVGELVADADGRASGEVRPGWGSADAGPATQNVQKVGSDVGTMHTQCTRVPHPINAPGNTELNTANTHTSLLLSGLPAAQHARAHSPRDSGPHYLLHDDHLHNPGAERSIDCQTNEFKVSLSIVFAKFLFHRSDR